MADISRAEQVALSIASAMIVAGKTLGTRPTNPLNDMVTMYYEVLKRIQSDLSNNTYPV